MEMNWKTIFVIVCALVLIQSVSASTAKEYRFDFSKPTIRDAGGGFLRVEMENLYSYGAPGEPILPLKTVKLLVPPHSRVLDVDVEGFDEEIIKLKGVVEPGQTPVPISSKKKFRVTSPSDEIYSSSREFPSEDFVVPVGVQDMRGYRILFVNLNPVKYSPSENTLSYYARMTVTLTLEEPESKALEKKPVGLFRNKRVDEDAVRGVVDNPGEIRSYKSVDESDGMKSTSLVNSSESYDYVIITDNTLNSSAGAYTFHNLSVWKNSRGVDTTIVTVEQIMADPDYECNGTFGDGCSIPEYNDTAAHIRNFIKDAYLNWGVTYVLLGGDVSVMPARGFYGYVASDPPENDTNIPADQYYAALNGSWNADNDSLWGEYDEMDLLEEVYVGRAPVETDTELSNFVRKTIHYESLSNEVPYLQKALMVGGKFNDDPTWGGDYKDEIKDGSSSHGNTTVGFPNNYTVDTLYDRDWPGNDWPKSEIISRINNNIHIVNHAGHSNTLMVMKIEHTDIPQINNTEYFFGYSQGCYAGNIGNEDCIMERFVKSENGSFAFIGNSRYGWYMPSSTNGPSQRFDREFFDALFGENLTHIGAAHQDSKRECSGLAAQVGPDNAYRWVYYELNLLGDPETELKRPIVNHDLELYNFEVSAYAKPNKTIKLNVTLRNKGLNNESNLIINFWVDNSLNDTVNINELYKGDSINLSFNWSIAVESTYNLSINVSNVTDEFILDNNVVEGEIIISSIEPILLVDDDGGDSYESYYEAALRNESIPYKRWDVEIGGSPTHADLSSYPITIWYTGNESVNTLNSTDQSSLQNYLNDGNRLFVTGQYIGEEIGSTSFYQNYLHATYVPANNGTHTLQEDSDDPISQRIVEISNTGGGDDGANNQVWLRSIAPNLPYGSEVFYYIPSGIAAIKADTGTYKVVYFAFGFEAVSTSEDRDTLMNRTYRWLNPVGPEVNLVSPADGCRNKSVNITFICNASDPLGLLNASFYSNLSGNWSDGTAYSISGKTYQISINETNISDGSYKWNCLFCDNMSENCEFAPANYTFTVDTLLSINIISPVNTTYGNSSVALNVSTNEDANCSYSLNGAANKPLYNMSNSGSATINGIEGRNNVTVYCIDVAGNINSSTAQFRIDEDPPSIVVYSPAPGPTDNQSITFNWSVTDNIDTHIDCNLTINGVVNKSVNMLNGTSHNLTLDFIDGVYSWNLTCWDNAFNINTSATRQLKIDTRPPNITSYSINPQIVINGSQVEINMNSTDNNPDNKWINITHNPSWTNTPPCNFTANQSGRYNVTFHANDTLGHESNISSYFIAAPSLEFNTTIRDRNRSGLNSTLTIYYGNNIIQSNNSLDGNFSLQVPDHVFDLMIQGLNNSLTVLLRDINLSADNNRNLSLDRIEGYLGFLRVYAIGSQYNVSNATLNISYNETQCNEDHLGVYKCSNWNFSGRVCVSIWIDVSGNATQDPNLDLFTVEVHEFSAYAIKQEPYCGDGNKDDGEQCDGSDFGGVSCKSYGFDKGTLSCTASCTISTGNCDYNTGGGGGSSGGSSSGRGGGALTVQAESCFDGLLNQNEEGIDCGGPCQPCASCTDGILNQGEQGIDCGGPCPPCETATTTSTTKTTTSTQTTATSTSATTTLEGTSIQEITTSTLTEENNGGDMKQLLIALNIILLLIAAALYIHHEKNKPGGISLREKIMRKG